jgi:two-component system response regulator RegA
MIQDPSGKTLLILEDDLDFRETLTKEFEERGLKVIGIEKSEDLSDLRENIDFAIVDLRLRGESGIDALQEIRRKWPKSQISMLTAYGSIATSVEAIKKGADNYLMKPCSTEEIWAALVCGSPEKEREVQKKNEPELLGLYEKEREYIEYVLALHNGNISRAAESLGIKRQSLQRKLKQFPPKINRDK